MFGPQHTSLIYETLLPNEIRFVRRTIEADSTFTIVLQKANLGDAPDFDVLSMLGEVGNKALRLALLEAPALRSPQTCVLP